MTTGDPISLKRRTTSEVDPYRMELSHGAMRVQYDLDLNAPSQRFIYDCCQGGGVYEAATAFLMTQVLHPGDTFLLCSDGLTRHVADQEIAEALATRDPQAACDALIATTLERGAGDNVTIVIARAKLAGG